MPPHNPQSADVLPFGRVIEREQLQKIYGEPVDLYDSLEASWAHRQEPTALSPSGSSPATRSRRYRASIACAEPSLAESHYIIAGLIAGGIVVGALLGWVS